MGAGAGSDWSAAISLFTPAVYQRLTATNTDIIIVQTYITTRVLPSLSVVTCVTEADHKVSRCEDDEEHEEGYHRSYAARW